MEKLWRNVAYWLVPHHFLSLLSYREFRTTSPTVASHNRVSLPRQHQLSTRKSTADLLFQNNSSWFDMKLASTHSVPGASLASSPFPD